MHNIYQVNSVFYYSLLYSNLSLPYLDYISFNLRYDQAINRAGWTMILMTLGVDSVQPIFCGLRFKLS